MSQDNTSGQRTSRLRGKGHVLAGALLAGIGSFWLAHKLGWIHGYGQGPTIFRPLLMVGAGLFLLIGSTHRQDRSRD